MLSFSHGLLRQIELLWLSAQRRGGGPLLAAGRKKWPAGGTEMTGHRDYSPGDDFHAIDWAIFARRNELHVKLFEGQADRDLYLLLDCSPSMALGRPSKFRVARRIAAALGYASLLNLDRLMVSVFADRLVDSLPPLRHASRVLRLLEFLEGQSPRGQKTDLLRAAGALVAHPHRGGTVLVISDLYAPEGFHRGLDLLQYHGFDPRIVHVIDPRDADPTLLGDTNLIDIESRVGLAVTITERTVRRYRELLAEFHESVRHYCRRRGMVYLPISCNRTEEEVMLRVLGCRHERSEARIQPAAAMS
jgi:uncharacterized protein (DUF58 family)